jgi:ferric-dicitrate binding protein FerR (iron transport regulator)
MTHDPAGPPENSPVNSIERLIKLAGEPDVPSPEGTRRARAASEQAWRQMLAQPRQPAPRRGKILALGLAMAASVAVVALILGRTEVLPVPVTVARVLTLDGVLIARREGAAIPLSANAPLPSGTTLETTDGRIALNFGSTLSMRVDRGTRLSFDSADQVTLLAGSLYVDSGGLNAHSQLRIRTPAGEVSHIGTQFQVFVAHDLMRVRVREGRVLVESRQDARRQELATGDSLEVRGDQYVVEHGLPSYGADWLWAQALAPVIEIENRPLSEFLAWLVREQGLRLHYSSERLQEQAGEIRLHGSLDGLGVDAMLERVSMVTGVRLEVRHGVLWVGA